jgi:capsular polysaccharide transport system ATP-binding protein
MPAGMAVLDARLPLIRDRRPNGPKPPIVVNLKRAAAVGANHQILFENLDLRIRKGQRWVVFAKQRLAGVALLRCIAGFKPLERGKIEVNGNISWPLGEIKALSKRLSAEENSNYLAGIYGQPGQRIQELARIRQMASMDIKEWLIPISQLPMIKRKEFMLALSLAFDFELYVVDPLILRPLLRAGSYSTHWQSLILERLHERGVITVADAALGIDSLCRRGLVLDNGKVVQQGAVSLCRSVVEARETD